MSYDAEAEAEAEAVYLCDTRVYWGAEDIVELCFGESMPELDSFAQEPHTKHETWAWLGKVKWKKAPAWPGPQENFPLASV